MIIEIDGILLKNGMPISNINNMLELFVKTVINEGEFTILRSKKPIEYKGARFRFNIWFKNDIIERVCLIAASNQENKKYIEIKDINELHKKWLKNNYGTPSKVAQHGNIYFFDDGKISSEYDPRSGNSEIMYVMHKN